MKIRLHCFNIILLVCCVGAFFSPIPAPAQYTAKQDTGKAPYSIYISTGDNLWTANSLPIDSKAAIEASLDLLKAMGVRRIYWRGLEMAVLVESAYKRPENARYYEAWKWFDHVYKEVDPDRTAVEAAHTRGMEIWGLGNWAEGYGAADTPPVWDYPFTAESRLRLEHPEWVPVDRHGVLKQAGPIDFSYPEARKALIDLHMKYMKRDKYDGALFFSYAENHSMRFQDEFGFNEPVVKEFKRRYGIDLRTHDFTRSASRADWAQLRGEYLTAFYRELKEELRKNNQQLGVMLDPHDLHFTQPWNQPELMQTAGTMYQDLETWVREGIVDQFGVFGSSSGTLQNHATDNMLWMTRGTPVRLGVFTSGTQERWKVYIDKGVAVINNFNEEEMFLDRSTIPPQPLSALKSNEELMRMRILSQIIYGKAAATVNDLRPLATDKNLLIRRMALKALGLTKDPAAVPIIEQGLEDPENAVRCVAALALSFNNRPESFKKLLNAVDKYGNHQLNEIAVNTLRKFSPSLMRPDLVKAIRTSKNTMIRTTALRTMEKISTATDIPMLTMALDDTDQFARLAAATALGFILNSTKAIETLIEATRHHDPVVSDRAATSLAIIVSRKEPELVSIRGQVLEALRVLYARLGDSCRRVDADWGYRPVGNALLVMGPDGEAVLKDFMLQTKDRRLAESAWKTLYIRQRSFSFSEVTEKENDEAFRMRPAFLNGPAETVVPETLRQQAIAQLRHNLTTESKLEKAHAAEYMLWLGLDEKKEVYKIFTDEDRRFSGEPSYRIALWRVLAQAYPDPQKAGAWIDKITKVWLDSTAVDQVAAAESLAKLNISVSQRYPVWTKKIVEGKQDPLSAYTFWSASVGIRDPDSIKNNRQAFLQLLLQGRDDHVKALAAYALRHLGRLTPQEWSLLSKKALSGLEKQEFEVYLLSSAFVNTPEDSLQSTLYREVRKALLQEQGSLRKDDLREMAAALAEKGGPEDLPVLISLLNKVNPDVQAVAAYAILRIDNRQRKK